MTKIAAWDKAAALSNPYMKLAIVALDETAQMLIKLYEGESSGTTWEIQMFTSLNDAEQWVL